MVHGLSVAAISIGGHYGRKHGERTPLIGQEIDGLRGMDHDNDGRDDIEPGISVEESDEGG
jgi:sodium/hydrogen antiporter